MSEVVEEMMGWPENPEGYPRCPKCREFVELTEVAGDYYFCDECKYTFPLAEAVE